MNWREQALHRFRSETFDLLIIGGGITGAAVARDAVSRGLSVALVDKNDFSFGTSSRSSKLIHGGLRYLENYEFGLVFESLAERAHLMKSVPQMVRPLPFYMPVYSGDRNGRVLLTCGMMLYDLLALGRTPELHRGLSRSKLLKEIPALKSEGLRGGFRYFDATMWDDVLTVETLRSAARGGAAVASYVEAVSPLWNGERIIGFRVRDLEKPFGQGDLDISARRVVVCAGPWTDLIGSKLTANWRPWLKPSRGVHLVFDQKRLPVPGAVVMSNQEDNRISFVIPRPDFGTGVVIVGTTDGPSKPEPEKTEVEKSDVDYLMTLLRKYFPSLDLKVSDILSAYVGVRPLVGGGASGSLQKVSREHEIADGPGGTVIVAGGKYTTHRKMGEQIVDFLLKSWRRDAREGRIEPPRAVTGSRTREPVNVRTTTVAVEASRSRAVQQGITLSEDLITRYGAEALDIMEIQAEANFVRGSGQKDPDGFPLLAAQLRFNMRNGMVLHLDDFYFRRTALFAARADHGLPWAEALSHVWAEESGASDEARQGELDRLKLEVKSREAWRQYY